MLLKEETSAEPDSRLIMFMAESIKAEIQNATSTETIFNGFLSSLFQSLIRHAESTRFIVHMFKGVFERIDFNYIDRVNLYLRYTELKQE